MKFKNSQLETLYTDAITLIKTSKIQDAISSLETLLLLLNEKRENKEIINHIARLVKTLQNIDPTSLAQLIEKLKAEKQTSSLEDQVDALENKAHEFYANNDFGNATIYYQSVAAKTKDNSKFASNYADALWCQGACYESIAASLKVIHPQEALKYIDKAMQVVKKSLAAYIPLNAQADIEDCKAKLKFLKEQQSLLQANDESTSSLLITLMSITQASVKISNDYDSLNMLADTATKIASCQTSVFSGYKRYILDKYREEKSPLSQTDAKPKDLKTFSLN